jgi:hypothetical protein
LLFFDKMGQVFSGRFAPVHIHPDGLPPYILVRVFY